MAQFSRLNPGDKIAFLVGPEGGLKESELDLLTKTFGFVPAGLGPRILRAETAPLLCVERTELRTGVSTLEFLRLTSLQGC